MSLSRYDKIPAHSLRLGMYVVELDRPWLDTPFLVQGFVIRTAQELEVLTELCEYVYIDSGRSILHKSRSSNPIPTRKKALTREKLQTIFKRPLQTFTDSSSFTDELVNAKSIYSDYESTVSRLYNDVRTHQKIDMQQVDNSISEVVDSVIRNPDACMLLAKLKRKSDYTYNHALGSSIWAAAFGRQLGLPKTIIHSIATGALLEDVGKISISDRLLNKNGTLTSEERELAKTHVAKGMDILANSRGVSSITREMLQSHHERLNGNGYPKRLKGDQIPVYGRIAGIVDTYDALINDKPYRKAMPASDAVKTLYNVRNIDFQSELVEEFIQAVGIYPAGSLVELSSGEVGIVVTEHRRRRLRPRLLILLDGNKSKLAESKFLDLFDVTHDDAGQPLDISRSLLPTEYGINPDDIFI